MKVLAKSLFLLGLLPFVGCFQQAGKEYTKEVGFFEKPEYGNFTDGIKSVNGKQTDYFILNIEIPECCQKGSSTVYLKHEQYFADSLKNSQQKRIEINNGLIPQYQVNTLNTFNKDSEVGVYFFCIMNSPLGGLDPKELVLWAYFKGTIYKFSGIVPVHPDWTWDSTYKFTPDSKLESDYPKAYEKLLSVWEQNIESYKQTIINY
jgi:hypothetical protein